jgi:xylulokinase
MTYFLGIDVGTSSLKAGLWHVDGRLMARATQTYPTSRPAPTWAEQNPQDWWHALRDAVQHILQKSRVSPVDIAGIGIDSTGWTSVPVDKAGNPLYAAMLWQDRRAQHEAADLRAHPAAAQIVQLAANPIDEGYATAKALWLQTHCPEIYRQIDQFLIPSGFLVRRLTGRNSCDYTQAYAFHCFDVANARWDEDAANTLNLDLSTLPPLFASCDVVGAVTASAALEFGLAAGTPVIAGGMDAAVAALGSGVAHSGETADQGGTAFGMSIAVDQVIIEPRLIFSPHVIPGLY